MYFSVNYFILRQNETLITKNNVKELLLNLSLTSQFSNLKIYIIEDCEKLTDNVYNALLKTLEEPEKGIYAFLLSSNITAVKPTIASRCQKFFVSSDVENECKKDYFNFAKKIVYDIEYIKNRSLRNDIKILFATVPVIIHGDGSNIPGGVKI